ncbi:SAM-dependent methyltransferase [Geomonas limicola]|uniref:SAM-dependent methyltransferase n=1 Tax=Geomonas limicola TaxID=2740186 RepID=A0A6V8N680_9BACT|nr:SAM-dependent methyltransferase [Geomonas limicola]GFO67073.1 SAM-dependent methyltransferase [Geomonas limicola]
MGEQVEKTELANILAQRIAAEGDLTFASFMEAALYEPGLGYYTSAGRKVGAQGDFYTSMNVHSAFGRMIAKEISRFWELLDSPANFTIAEAGAGGGQLALDILDALAELNQPLYQGICYRLIEKEPSLKEAQETFLARHGAHLAWSTPEELASGNLSFTGCIISNELFDAMPVHIVEMTGEGLKELYVGVRNGELVEKHGPLSDPQLAEYFTKFQVALMPGQRAEVNLCAAGWIAAAAATLERGFVLTVDYGYLAEELYAPQRKDGTLMCYYQHQTGEDPFELVGQQDITTHVNFSDLMAAGVEAGLQNVWYGEQYRFLLGTGMVEELMRLEAAATSEQERIAHRLNLKKLMLPEGGMGDTFKVLIQAKGVENPQLLCMRKWGMGL